MVTRVDIADGLIAISSEAQRLNHRIHRFRGDITEFSEGIDDRIEQVKLALGKLNDFVGRMEKS